ncbi:MAG: hypothetical protein M5R37_09515 [Melioribacteraceae bacterium]|nr:hypothetical protein [Melioribacteraceae bacterium]
MEEKDILSEIFDHLFSSVASSPNKYRKVHTDIKPHIKLKIDENFSDAQTYVKQTYFNNIHYINLSRTFIQNKLKIKPEPVYDLLDTVQSLYLKHRKVADVNKPINDFIIIEKIAADLLPKKRKSQASFKSAAKAIVMMIFEMCDIGMPPQSTRKIKTPKRISDPSLFD